MKKILKVMMMVFVLMLLIALPALAEGAAQPAQTAYDWQSLGTIAGATAAVLMIVQLIKAPLDRIWKVPTRLVVYVIALGLMLVAQAFGGGLTWESGLLAAVNAVMVALSAYGAYEMTFKKAEEV